MSASSFTDWQITCNGSDDGHPCRQGLWVSELSVMDGTAADVRKHLKHQGWAVGLSNPDSRERLDYCPKHKPVTS